MGPLLQFDLVRANFKPPDHLLEVPQVRAGTWASHTGPQQIAAGQQAIVRGSLYYFIPLLVHPHTSSGASSYTTTERHTAASWLQLAATKEAQDSMYRMLERLLNANIWMHSFRMHYH